MAHGKIDIGLVGITALYWPLAMAQGLQKHPSGRLRAFCTLGDSTPEIQHHLGLTPNAFATKFDLKQYAGWEEMLAREKLQALIICTRHTEHAAMVERLAPYGIDLYVLKSFATTLEDCRRIVAAGRKYRIKIAVGPSGRFIPALAAAKQALPRIGAPFSMRLCHHHGVIDVFQPRDWYRDPAEGGPELSLAWYIIDLIRHFMGQPVERVAAEYGNFNSPRSPYMDCGKLLLRFKDGAQASADMYFCNRVPYPSWEMEIMGPRGVITVRESGPELSAGIRTSRGYQPLAVHRCLPSWELFWVDEFRRKRKPSINAEEAAEITRLSLAARQAAHTGKWVSL
jgi:UDP-N-acetylglucosamine 3-dehydrogenase